MDKYLRETFGFSLPKGDTVHHKNRQRWDNRIENLEWRTGQHGQGASVKDLVEWASDELPGLGVTLIYDENSAFHKILTGEVNEGQRCLV